MVRIPRDSAVHFEAWQVFAVEEGDRRTRMIVSGRIYWTMIRSTRRSTSMLGKRLSRPSPTSRRWLRRPPTVMWPSLGSYGGAKLATAALKMARDKTIHQAESQTSLVQRWP